MTQHTTVNRNAPFILRNERRDPLDLAQLRKSVPAVFAEKPIDGVSDQYGFISTANIIEGLQTVGFVPVEATSYHRRDPEARQFAKHMVTLRPAGKLSAVAVGEVVPQVSIVNSHDRSNRFTMVGGLFRLICSNGLMVNSGTVVEPVKVRHTANVVDAVALYCADLVEQMGDLNETIREMTELKLTDQQQATFAQRVLEGLFNVPTIDPAVLLQARRPEDAKPDLWHTFNRVQENVMRGGLPARATSGRSFVTRPLNSINVNVRFNTHAWDVAMETLGRIEPAVEEASKAIAKAATSAKAAAEAPAPAKSVWDAILGDKPTKRTNKTKKEAATVETK